jgi:hypothetical protein
MRSRQWHRRCKASDQEDHVEGVFHARAGVAAMTRVTLDLRDSIPRVGFGLACAVGLVGAFVGLNVSSFWFDELFTAWVVGHGDGFGQIISRLLTDMHPPLYYLLISAYSRIFGASDAALRSFSALCGCGAILVFVLGTGRTFSLNARLFAAAIATSSGFWYFQSQNARDYTLSLLIGAGVLALSLKVLQARQRPGAEKPAALWALFGLMVLSAFTHFYLMYECLAVLIILGVFCRQWRGLLAVAFVSLLVISQAYVHFVIQRYTLYSLTTTWIGNGPLWYLFNLIHARKDTINRLAILALAICAVSALYVCFRGQGSAAPRKTPALLRGRVSWMEQIAALADPVPVLCLGVPVIVLLGGIVSSTLISPNFTDRNMLVVSPFLWGAYAWIYSVGPERSSPRLQLAAVSVLSALALVMMTAVAGRAQPHNEPFKASAEWIQTFPACRGTEIPVLTLENPSWTRPDFYALVVKDAYGRYLNGFATPRLVWVASPNGLPGDLRAEIQRRVDGQDCPIIGWSSHGFDMRFLGPVSKGILATVGRPTAAATLAVKKFETYSSGLDRHAEPSGTFVLYMTRDPHP